MRILMLRLIRSQQSTEIPFMPPDRLVLSSQGMRQHATTTESQLSCVCWSDAIDYSSILSVGVRLLFSRAKWVFPSPPGIMFTTRTRWNQAKMRFFQQLTPLHSIAQRSPFHTVPLVVMSIRDEILPSILSKKSCRTRNRCETLLDNHLRWVW